MKYKILSDSSIPEIKLLPFNNKKNDEKLKLQYLSWLNNQNVVKLIGSEALLNENKKISFIEDSFIRFSQINCRGFFIKYQPKDIFIGTVKLDQISTFTKSAMDGIMIGEPDFWGLGISRKAYTILLKHAFYDLKLNKVYGGCNENNIPMIKTYQKLGYTLEGRFRKSDFIEKTFSDHLYFGILKDEFTVVNSKK